MDPFIPTTGPVQAAGRSSTRESAPRIDTLTTSLSGTRTLSSTAVTEWEIAPIFRRAVASFGPEPVLILAHNDADGLSAAAVLARAFCRVHAHADIRLVGRGENPWSAQMRTELASRPVGGLIVADLGVRGWAIRDATPTVIVDHHVPSGMPAQATVISGFRMDPVPTSSVLAYRCASALADVQDLVWLAALGVIGDMADPSGFTELAEARARYGITSLRTAAALINQPRRASSGDASPALSLLMKASGPREVVSGVHPETAQLIAARDEVRAELKRVRRTAPRVIGEVALILFSSRCQIHPLVAQAWTARMKNRIVLAANTGYREGWVHFAARSSADRDLVAFLREHAPAGSDGSYGGGHRNASGGALRIPQWNTFVRRLGFSEPLEVPE